MPTETDFSAERGFTSFGAALDTVSDDSSPCMSDTTFDDATEEPPEKAMTAQIPTVSTEIITIAAIATRDLLRNNPPF